ncbi:MAG: hypothetical protein BWY76_03072 [bacterium ADurb.Bin429]|nr:MAG: hypothetical protein BWY76_03072 [bacterium ADurb.Bin429]
MIFGGIPGACIHPVAGEARGGVAERPALDGAGEDVRFRRAARADYQEAQRVAVALLLAHHVLQRVAAESGAGGHHEGKLAYRAVGEAVGGVVIVAHLVIGDDVRRANRDDVGHVRAHPPARQVHVVTQLLAEHAAAGGFQVAPGSLVVKFAADVVTVSVDDLAEQPGVNPLLHRGIEPRVAQFKTDLQEGALAFGGLHHLARILQRHRHRFLAHHRLPRR